MSQPSVNEPNELLNEFERLVLRLQRLAKTVNREALRVREVKEQAQQFLRSKKGRRR